MVFKTGQAFSSCHRIADTVCPATHVQAIIFRDGKAVGRMVSPELRIERLESPRIPDQPSLSPAASPAPDARPSSPSRPSQAPCSHTISAGSAIQMVQLAFGMWLPVAGQKAAVVPDGLRIPVDSKFTDSEFSIQVPFCETIEDRMQRRLCFPLCGEAWNRCSYNGVRPHLSRLILTRISVCPPDFIPMFCAIAGFW